MRQTLYEDILRHYFWNQYHNTSRRLGATRLRKLITYGTN